MSPPEPYEAMLRKASRDARHARKFENDAEVDDEHLGFCCQQAVEKSLKAVLSFRGVAYRRTHDIGELVEPCREHGIVVPREVTEAITLTPFAVEFRYDDLPDEEEGLDRAWAVRMATEAVAWAESEVRAG